MIDITEFHGRTGITFEVWSDLTARAFRVVADGPTEIDALVDAEKKFRDELAAIQTRLQRLREQEKASQ